MREREDADTIDNLLLSQLCGEITEVLIADSEHIFAPTVMANKNEDNTSSTKF